MFTGTNALENDLMTQVISIDELYLVKKESEIFSLNWRIIEIFSS